MAKYDRSGDRDLEKLNEGLYGFLEETGTVKMDRENGERIREELRLARRSEQVSADKKADRQAQKAAKKAAKEAAKKEKEAQKAAKHNGGNFRPVSSGTVKAAGSGQEEYVRPKTGVEARRSTRTERAHEESRYNFVDPELDEMEEILSKHVKEEVKAVEVPQEQPTPAPQPEQSASETKPITAEPETKPEQPDPEAKPEPKQSPVEPQKAPKTKQEQPAQEAKQQPKQAELDQQATKPLPRKVDYDSDLQLRRDNNYRNIRGTQSDPNNMGERPRSRYNDGGSERYNDRDRRASRSAERAYRSEPTREVRSERGRRTSYGLDEGGYSKKKKGGAGKVLGIILAIILGLVILAGIVAFVAFRLYYGKSNFVDDSKIEMHLEEAESELMLESEPTDFDVSTVKQVSADEADKTYSVLLIGSDRRDSSWYGNSDTMVLLTINDNVDKVFMVSFMRDLYADIPDVGIRKLNNAYAVGGGPLLMKTLKTNYGVDVDDYVSVDFDSLEEIIDMVGGVDVDIDEAEATYMNNAGISVSVGTNHLGGADAVSYSRIRHVGNSDWERTSRQREVLMSIVNTMRSVSAARVTAIANDLLPLVTHNMKATEVTSLISRIPSVLKYEFVTDRIPYEGTYYIDNEILVPDLDETIKRLHAEIYAKE